MKKYEADFNSVFIDAMKFNLETIQKEKKMSGPAQLIGDYIGEYILKPTNVLENQQLTNGLAYFYETREKKYGLD